MGQVSTYAVHKLLDLTFGGQAFSSPATLYASLHTASLSVLGAGTEVSGNNYSRKSITANTTNFPASSGGSCSLAVQQTFAASSASWGTVTDSGLWDASSAGNLLLCDAITASQAIGSGEAPYLAVGDLAASFGGSISTYLANKWLDHLLNGTAYSAPATVYLALFVGASEVSGNNYSRKAVTCNQTNFPAASSRAIALHVATSWAAPTGSWGTPDTIKIFDASSSGNILFSKAITSPKAITSFKPARLPADALTITLT